MSEESKQGAPGGASVCEICGREVPTLYQSGVLPDQCWRDWAGRNPDCHRFGYERERRRAESAERELESCRSRLSTAEKEITSQSKELDCGNLSCRKCAACTRILLDASRKGRDEALFQHQGLECVRLKDNEYLLAREAKALGALRAIMRLARCDVGHETAALDQIYETGWVALSGSNITDAPEAPKASEIASDSSALEKALGALRAARQAIEWATEDDPGRPLRASTIGKLYQTLHEIDAALSGGAHVDAPKAPKTPDIPAGKQG